MERILACVADKESLSILASVERESKTAASIERDIGCCASTLYRKLAQMKDCGLLMIDRFDLRPDGKREARYLSAFTEIRLLDGGEGLEIELVENRRSMERRWFETFFSKSDISYSEQSSNDF